MALRSRQLGQGMTEYIIIVALIAVAAIGVYQAFGDVIRGQTSVAASSLAGQKSGDARTLAKDGGTHSNERAQTKGLKDFEDKSGL
nr:hypothetical protein [Massilia sp. CF038]